MALDSNWEKMPGTLALQTFLQERERRHPEARFLNFTSVWVRATGAPWIHVFTRAVLDENVAPSETIDGYRNARIVRWTWQELPTSIAGRRGLRLEVPGFSDQLLPFKEEAVIEVVERHSNSNIPISHINLWLEPETEPTTMPAGFGRPFTGFNLPAYENGVDLVRKSTGDPGWENNWSFRRGLMLFCADQRGRIEDVYPSDRVVGAFTVRTSSRHDLIKRLSIIGHRDSGSDNDHGDCARDIHMQNLWRFQIQPGWQYVSLLALDAGGELIDQTGRRFIQELRQHQPDVIHPEELTQLIQTPEGDQLERKSWKVFRDGGREVILKVAVAFANTVGGKLLLGVNDNGEPDGQESSRDPNGHVVLTGEVQRRVEDVCKWLQDDIEPSITFSVQPTYYRGRIVLVVQIHEGTMKPYCTHTGSYFIRKGAHSSSARPNDIRQMCAASGR